MGIIERDIVHVIIFKYNISLEAKDINIPYKRLFHSPNKYLT